LFLFTVAVSVVGLVQAPGVAVVRQHDSTVTVREVTRLYPVTVRRVVTPHTVEEIAAAITGSTGPIAIGGGRYSMGGQTATPGGLQLDLREFRGVVALDTVARTITVHSGTTWREVQQAIDTVGLAVKIMQTYNTFTVGGALSVNAHGRYIGQGPLVRSVRAITLVLADGRVVTATPTENRELFFGAIGGYGALGVIADVTLDLARNVAVERVDETFDFVRYPEWFQSHIRNDTTVIFHNGDLYPPAFEEVHAVSYRTTDRAVTQPLRLQPADQGDWTHRSAYAIISGWPFGNWMRRHVIDPWVFRGNPVTWRNYEASYDVSELEPASRDRHTFVLQEYFVPAESLGAFVPRMGAILREHEVNTVNVSIRHALPDPGTLLAWAPQEVFALVLYYRQGTNAEERREVGEWTRELIDAVLQVGGRYYLPYQPHATRAQFHRAYPGADSLFALKRRVDPAGRFTNTLWDIYAPDTSGAMSNVNAARMPGYLPGEVAIALDSLDGYDRDEANEYLTHPEWDLVYSSEAYARWLTAGKRPSQFPYLASVGTFWRSYIDAWRAAKQRNNVPFGTHLMLNVIGFSTALEYGLKGLYEHTIGWLTEQVGFSANTAEDAYAAKVAQEYAELIVQRGWYEFRFGRALKELWTTVPFFGPGFIRKFERRMWLSAEYSGKSVYAWLIGLGTATAYDADENNRYLVVAGWDDALAGPDSLTRAAWLDRHYALLRVPRYTPFRDAVLRLADHAGQVRIAEIAGNRVVTFTGTAPQGWEAPAATTRVTAYTDPAEPTRVRIVLAVDAPNLLEVLAGIKQDGRFVVDHIYDY
jgi:FAD/FMN-containing dehydrogenase